MSVDLIQSMGTLIGLKNRLVLSQPHGLRLLLVLHGDVSHSSSLKTTHTFVKVAKKRSGTFHTFHIDTNLGQLTGHGGLESKIFLAYLHALTSFCLPDPLTGLTGTERALAILRSAETRSFDLLVEGNAKLLRQIAELTPSRAHYPANERVMQTVNWSPKLGFLAQHGAFRVEVDLIFDQATRSRMFYPDAPPLPELPSRDVALARRDSIRSAWVRVSGFGAEDYTTSHDTSYTARDRGQTSSRFSDAFATSTFLYQQKRDLQQTLPVNVARALWNALTGSGTVLSSRTALPELEYDATLLEKSPQVSVTPAWLALNQRVRSEANTFSLMMWLSTLACGSNGGLDPTVLQVLALSFTRSDVAQVQLPPDCATFRIAQGKSVQREALSVEITALLVDLIRTPAYSMVRHVGEKIGPYTKRRQQAYQALTTPIVSAIVNGLMAQWPCLVPTAPDMSSITNASAYIDINAVMNMARPKFKTWYENLDFFRYLQRLERIVVALPVVPSHARIFRLAFPSPPTRGAGYVGQQQLLASNIPRPVVSIASELGTDWLVPRIEVKGHDEHLEALITGLCMATTASASESKYATRLKVSAEELNETRMDYRLSERDGIKQELDANLQACQKQVHSAHSRLVGAITPTPSTLTCAATLSSVKQWPRVPPGFFLRQLNHLMWPSLDQQWRDAIVEYALMLTALQRAERLLRAFRSGSDLDLVNELRTLGHANWKPHDHPDTLLLEVESGVLVREVQEDIAAQMRSPDGNAVLQLNMGEGKSSLIVPIVAAALANGSQLVRVVVAKPQFKQMAQMMISKLGGMLNRRIYYMPFSRALRLTQGTAGVLREMLLECMSTGGILLVQPEHILSFKLMALETNILGQEDVSRSLLSMQDFFDRSSRDLVDESDENFSAKFELIYTIGTQCAVDFGNERWSCIHDVLELIRRQSQATACELPESLELTHCLPGRFPRTRILNQEAQHHLLGSVAYKICESGMTGFPIARQPLHIRETVHTYITKLDLTRDEIDAVEVGGAGSFWSDSTKEMLLLLRGLFAAGVLSFVFGQKRWRVNYGLDSSRHPSTKLAVPYRAKDMPSPRSEFSHPDVIISLTTLSYYYGGLQHDDLATAFDHLSRSDQADSAYQTWHLEGINLRDKHQFTTELLPRLRFGKATIDYFLANVVFPKEMKEFPYKLSASGWDVGKTKCLPTTGFSGTNDSRDALPLHMKQIDLPAQLHTKALVLGYLLQTGNNVVEMPAASVAQASTPDAERLLNMVMSLDPPARVILDVGAQILEMSNIEVAKRWLALSDASIHAAVFFDEHDELSVVSRKDRVELLQTSSFATQLNVCLVFLDESHTRGTDLRLPESYRAAVTLGAGLTKDRLTQACMRMRKLGKGQTVVFCVPPEIKARIATCTTKPLSSRVVVADIIRWTISETLVDMRRCMPLWATQGVRFVRQNALWQKGQSGLEFLEDEAQSLEARYRPSTASAVSLFAGPQHDDIDRIQDRCREFENLSFSSTTLQEEQERELSPEIEQERQIQKPAAAVPLPHNLHADLVLFVKTGTLPTQSRACQAAFNTLSTTTAALGRFDVAEMSSGGNELDLLVTVDFARTIDTSRSGPSSPTDSYQRPVQWVLTASNRQTVTTMLVISPFEAQELYTRVQASSKVVLHLYTPRCNSGYRSLDRLDFYSVPHQHTPLAIPARLITQLNLFSGQLYINDYEDFRYMCSYLGLATETAPEGWEVAADGFIARDGQGRVGGGSNLTSSPVKFLQTLMAIRRDGQGFSRRIWVRFWRAGCCRRRISRSVEPRETLVSGWMSWCSQAGLKRNERWVRPGGEDSATRAKLA
ncbi:hypothetical protein LTR97_011393 [Elasticomyces elasticus]|uniref:ubiquitinyl hydrolase 1 n=1 Tax=Elasticomyces elasticus TaxID=574655 RepID=A0AAN7ZZS5_9PEZI|nr:hypothetical protein LTR97_011393 [Elasticomyces elasticus]